MFGRIVTIDGTEFFVTCSPDTPYSEILRRAAVMAEREESPSGRIALGATRSIPLHDSNGGAHE